MIAGEEFVSISRRECFRSYIGQNFIPVNSIANGFSILTVTKMATMRKFEVCM
jgi:hypothetical protein